MYKNIIKTEDLIKNPAFFDIQPNKYQLMVGTSNVFCFGIEHTYNPSDKQFIDLENFYNKFLTTSAGNNKVCLLEANELPMFDTAIDKDQIISKYGERGYMISLCKKNNISFTYSERNTVEEIKFLSSLTTRKLAELTIIIRSLAVRINKVSSYESAIDIVINSLMNELLKSDESLQVTKKEIKDYIEQKIAEKGAEKDIKLFIKWLASPTTIDSEISELRRKLTDWRNQNLAESICKYIGEKNDIFVLFGISHILQIIPALIKMSGTKIV